MIGASEWITLISFEISFYLVVNVKKLKINEACIYR
jgi:hypothetical protein